MTESTQKVAEEGIKVVSSKNYFRYYLKVVAIGLCVGGLFEYAAVKTKLYERMADHQAQEFASTIDDRVRSLAILKRDMQQKREEILKSLETQLPEETKQ